MRQSGIDQNNSSKSIKYERVSMPYGLEKRGSLYSSGYSSVAGVHDKVSSKQ